MSFHVGIDPSWGHISYYNEAEKSTNVLKIMKVDTEEIAKVSLMFDEISSKINGNLGYACICLSPNYGNEIRKEFITAGLKCGFKNVEIINYSTAIYLNAISQKTFNLKNGHVIWIYRYSYFNVWQVMDMKAKYMGFWQANSSNQNELEKIVKESNLNKGPDIVLYDSEIDKETVRKISACDIMAYNDDEYSFSTGSLIRARKIAGELDNKNLSVIKFISRKYCIIYGEKEITKFELFEESPILVTHKLIRAPNKDSLEIVHKTFDDSRKEFIKLPNHEKIYFTFEIDTNEIYSVTFVEHTNAHIKIEVEERTTNGITKINGALASLSLTPAFPDTMHYTIPAITTPMNTKVKAVGIDLGTSRCCAAINRKNGIVTVHLENTGERLLPSYVAYDEENVKCGKVVANRLRQFSKSTVFDAKRIIGRSFNDIEIDSNWPLRLSQDDENEKVVMEVERCNNVMIRKTPEDVAADLLRYMKEKVEEYQGTKLTDLVITVPAAFTEVQKEATVKAAKLAGWETAHLLPEPVAAAFTYLINETLAENSNVLLFDLGGGTLDVCIFKVKNNQIEIISHTGDTKLGGRDFDNVLFNYFKNQLGAKYGIALVKDKKYKLILDCQRIKEDLSTVENSPQVSGSKISGTVGSFC